MLEWNIADCLDRIASSRWRRGSDRSDHHHMKPVLAALALTLLVACLLDGCGSNGVFIISFSSGTIAGAPTCRANGGQFNLRDQEGLVLLVILTSNTQIVAAGNRGTCKDLSPDAAVTVRGPRNGDQINAQTVRVQ